MFSRPSIWLIPAVLLASTLWAEEQNSWPVSVREQDSASQEVSVEYAGPLFFHHQAPGEPDRSGFRPFYLSSKRPGVETDYLLYPFFTWRNEKGYHSFSFFELVNESSLTEPGLPPSRGQLTGCSGPVRTASATTR